MPKEPQQSHTPPIRTTTTLPAHVAYYPPPTPTGSMNPTSPLRSQFKAQSKSTHVGPNTDNKILTAALRLPTCSLLHELHWLLLKPSQSSYIYKYVASSIELLSSTPTTAIHVVQHQPIKRQQLTSQLFLKRQLLLQSANQRHGANHNTLTKPLFPFLICLCWRRAVV